MQTIVDGLQWWAKSRPDVIALSLGDDHVTYGEWVPWIERAAALLIKKGVRPGDRINACGPNSLEYCTLAMAAMRAGAIIAPLNSRFTAHELLEIVEDHEPRLIVATDDQAAKFEGSEIPKITMADIGAVRTGEPAEVEHEMVPDACVLIISTSGSTAKPKGVMFSHRTMTAYSMANAIEDGALRDGGGVIIVAPLATSAGMVQLIHYTFLGCTLYFEPVFNAERFLDILIEKPIAVFAGAPPFFEFIAACPRFAEADLSSLKSVYAGGARVTKKLYDSWATKGLHIRQTYGQTEAGGNSTVNPVEFAASDPEKCGWGGIFMEHKIVDEDGEEVPRGTVGQILIRGPALMLGYWNNPEQTAETIKDGWLHTGDLGTMDERGLITFIDRIKDIIVSGGLNISAAEIERAVIEYPGILEVVVIAAHDPKFDETPMAIVHATEEIDVSALIDHCNGRLADYKVPRYVAIEADPLPRLATGKLSKPELREKYKNAHETLSKVR